MSGDGVSMPTVLSQLGNVAKAQARSNQAASTGTSALPVQDKEELQPLKKVPESEKAQKQTLEPRRDGDRRKQRRPEEPDSHVDKDEEPPAASDDHGPAESGLGLLVDRKA